MFFSKQFCLEKALLLGLCVLLAGCGARNKNTAPSIEFTTIPLAGVGGPDKLASVEGRVTGARPGQQIVLFARWGTWWVQPLTNQPFTRIQPDSRWKNSTHFGTEYAALLVEPEYHPPATMEVLPSTGAGVVALAITKGRPVFWQTWWFLSSCALGLALTLAGTYRYYSRRLEKREQQVALMEDALQRRLRAEEGLRATEERYRSLYEGTPSMYFTVDPGGVVLSVNEFGAQQLGYTAKELVGESVLRVFYEADKAQALAHVEKCLAHPGQVFQWELRKVRKDGRLLWVKEVARTVKNPEGNPVVLIVCDDITEVRRLEDQLRQAQKMEALGQLAGGVAHDFNNLLEVIIGYSEILTETTEPSARQKTHIQQVQNAAQRAAALTRQLLAFSRKQVLQPTVLDLNVAISDVEKLLRRLISENIEIITRLDPALGSVRADRGQIEQAILNLCVNARDAMPAGGKLTIGTTNVDLDDAYAATHPEATAGLYVMLSVSDTGVGMDAVTRARIFEPFFTTKERGKGTGLGLSTVYGIVKQSDGHIWVYSEPGRGTTFKLYLPRVAQPATALEPARVPSVPVGGSETILLVEDEESVRRLISDALSARGYRVLSAPNAEKALEISQAQVQPIHILVSDIVMPGKSGNELAREMLRSRPNLRILFLSGYTDNQFPDMEHDAAFLQKPFALHTLTGKVRELLDTPGSDS